MDEADVPVVALLKFAGYLLERIEAVEAILIQKGLASKEEIRAAIAQAEKNMGRHLEIGSPSEEERERAIADILKRLRSRAEGRLR